jgi:hypothetical protein
MSWASRAFGLLLVIRVGVCSLSAGALAQAKSSEEQPEPELVRARELAHEGIELLEQERWQEAHERLSEAYDLFRAPTVGVLDARALEKMGKLVAAHQRYREAAQFPDPPNTPKPFQRAINEARREQQRLAAEIPTLMVDVRHADPSHRLIVDGKLLPERDWGKRRQVDPGTYTIVAKRGDDVELSERITIERAAAAHLVLTLRRAEPALPAEAPSPATPPSPQSEFAWASLGIGVAGMTTGLIAGAMMLDAKSDLDDRCRSTCPTSSRDTLDRFRTARTVSIVGYSVGAVGLGLGLWLLVDGQRAAEAPITGAVLFDHDGGQLRLRGSF